MCPEKICVCICTWKRTEMLLRLLEGLEVQETDGLFEYAVIVVDNDSSASACLAVESYAKLSRLRLRYYVEPRQNIALARNMAIDNASGDFVALIDDDEVPIRRWLLNHYKSIKYYNADGVLGPVVPNFEVKPPQWVVKGRFFERPTHLTGHRLKWQNTRTGNVLFRRAIFEGQVKPFDPSYGSGGEDRDFFRRMISAGKIFVWCNEAVVFETVPSKRWGVRTLLLRALLRGKMALQSSKYRGRSVAYSTMAVAAYLLLLPLITLSGTHTCIKCLIRIFDHVGKILAYFGMDVVKEKYI